MEPHTTGRSPTPRSIELITLTSSGRTRDGWDHGPQRVVAATAPRLRTALASTEADAVLCLDARLPLPSKDLLDRLLDGPADVWHSGLALGLDGQPALFDHVNPLWMLNAAANADIESTSWRVSPRALLVRATVLDQLGGPAPGFDTLAGAGLELGLRWTNAGALVRHVPDLGAGDLVDPPPSDADGIRLLSLQVGRRWALWALQRAVATKELRVRQAMRLVRTGWRSPTTWPHYATPDRAQGDTGRTVSVILPTLDRYPYLVPLLHQLAAQTVPPHEVIIVDQTPIERRRDDLASVEPDLPVSVIGLPDPGQSTARNAALRASTGELLLFIDDDDDIAPDLIERHLLRLTDGIVASSGGVDDATAGPPPEGFRHRRASDVFPTNNTLLRRSALLTSGLFDPTYDRGSRADHDLGMRLHRDGALLVYDPTVMVFHHHAPAGGLRAHGARTVTRAGSRRSLAGRHLPSDTELYLGLRYFTEHQVREAAPVQLVSLLTGSETGLRRTMRTLTQLALLPSSARTLSLRLLQARAMLATRPPIPQLTDGPADLADAIGPPA